MFHLNGNKFCQIPRHNIPRCETFLWEIECLRFTLKSLRLLRNTHLDLKTEWLFASIQLISYLCLCRASHPSHWMKQLASECQSALVCNQKAIHTSNVDNINVEQQHAKQINVLVNSKQKQQSHKLPCDDRKYTAESDMKRLCPSLDGINGFTLCHSVAMHSKPTVCHLTITVPRIDNTDIYVSAYFTPADFYKRPSIPIHPFTQRGPV